MVGGVVSRDPGYGWADERFHHGDNPQQSVSVDNYGTRHRSAFRFSSSLDDSVAFIVSQDGGVKARKGVQDKVFLWPDII